MPAYPKDSPFHDRLIRQIVGSACFAEIALANGGLWSPAGLEEELDGRSPGEQTGRYSRMTRGVLPSRETLEELQERLGNSCQVLKLYYHPFWKLLCMQPPTQQEIERALLSITCNVRHRIWLYPPDKEDPMAVRIPRPELTVEKTEQIAKYRNFDALVALIALAREARIRGTLQTYFRNARMSLEIFPYVVTRHPELHICWYPLASRLTNLIWKPQLVFSPDMQLKTSLSELKKQIGPLARAARRKGIPLPPQQILRRYNRIME